MSALKHILKFVLLFTVSGMLAEAQDLKIAAASDLTQVMQTLAPAFEKQSGAHMAVSLGSSGNFFAQIQNGAPFDVFLSADKSYPEKLEQAGQAEPGSLTNYARGRLVIWTSNSSGIRLRSANNKTLGDDLKVLTSPQAHKIAIANPEHAPYGRAAVAALQHYGIYDQVKDKLVLGENISQTAQFAQSGNADVAFIALSGAMSAPMENSGRWLLLPRDSYPPIEQTAVIVKSSKNQQHARRFLDFLTSREGQTILRAAGFEAAQK